VTAVTFRILDSKFILSSAGTSFESAGRLCNSAKKLLEREREHYQKLLNHKSGTTCRELDSAAAAATPDSDTLENAPSLEEVCKAIGKLRNGRAAGLDDISPELLKCAKKQISFALHTMFAKVWITGKVPADWRDAIIVSLYKGKGSKSNCATYRPISLLSVPGKVFAHVILGRL